MKVNIQCQVQMLVLFDGEAIELNTSNEKTLRN